MLRTLLHKTLLTAIAILLGGWAVVAQQYVVKGTSLNFKVDSLPNYEYHWTVTSSTAPTVKLVSKSHKSGDFEFADVGEYIVKVYPEDLGTHCFGDPLSMIVIVDGVAPTAVFEDLVSPQVCATNNGGDPNGKVNITVNYTGPKPWTFKYSLDSGPGVTPKGAEELYVNSFEFELEISNTTGILRRAEIQLVEAKTLSGVPVAVDLENQKLEVDVMALPNTLFGDYSPIVQAGTTQSYTAIIGKNENYKLFIPDGASILNKKTTKLTDKLHSELSFDVQWGSTLGDYQIKLIERTAFDCAGDTIYAAISVVESFELSLGNDISICEGESANLTPTIDFDDTYSYLWSNGSSEDTITVTETGTYSVTVRDKAGNEKSDEIEVIVHPLPIVDLGSDITLFDTETAILDAGNPGATFDWSTLETTQTITVSDEKVYSVQVTDEYGCRGAGDVSVFSRQFTVGLGDDPDPICMGESIDDLTPIITGVISSSVSYKWTTPVGEETTESITVNVGGEYCVSVTDNVSGNTENDCVLVTVNSSPVVDLGEDRTLQTGEEIELDAQNEGSDYKWYVDPEYSLKPNSISQKITIDQPGEYRVVVTNENGCIATDTVNFSIGSQYIVDLPSAFSPNSDGKNDRLQLVGDIEMIDKSKPMSLIIYNRLGHKVYQANREVVLTDPWDGTYRGQSLDMDVYVYFLNITFIDGSSLVKQGNITLLH